MNIGKLNLLFLPETEGGASLTILEGNYLREINFDGFFLELRLSLLEDSCIQTLIPITIIPDLPINDLENLQLERTNPKFNYLRNLKDKNNFAKLKKLVGSNIRLVKFGSGHSEFNPKDYDPSFPFLLTTQMLKILQKVIERNEDGYVLSGPHGIAKSYTMYFLACYAFVNSIPLIYVPKCAIWVDISIRRGVEAANEYIFRNFYYWNSDLFSLEQLTEMKNDVFTYLKNNIADKRPVLYLFEEHNELFNRYNPI